MHSVAVTLRRNENGLTTCKQFFSSKTLKSN